MPEPPVRTRFAPSPTGYLHVGGARTALFNWLFARRHGGSLVLRIEDTDANRNLDAGLEAILGGLRWLGIDWDEGPEAGGGRGPYFQSQRREIYDRHLARLEDAGHVYDDGGAIRFRSPGSPVTVDDRICGRVTFERDEPDMTLRRPDGSYIFHFVNVVDDIEMGITHVIRGEDHLANTPKHLELFAALEEQPPVYAHIPLILNGERRKLSKRDAGASVLDYEERGFLPEAVLNYLCLLGWSPKDDRERLAVEEVLPLFDFEHMNRSNAIFDLEKCRWFSGQYMADLDEASFARLSRPFLDRAGLPGGDDPRWDAILPLARRRVQLLSEVPELIVFFFEEECRMETPALEKLRGQGEEAITRLEALSAALAAVDPWEAEALQAGVKAAAAGLGVKPGALMFPLRVAASGRSAGPDLFPMLAILGREKVLARLASSAENLR